MIVKDVNKRFSPLFSTEEVFKLSDIGEKVTLNKLITDYDKIVILGEPGSGKSFELDKLFNELWRIKETTQLVPFFITLKKYHSSCSFEDLIPFKEWKNFPNVIFILDGLDETAYPHDFISVLEVFINNYRQKNIKVIISSRTNIYFNHQLKLESFKPFNLEPLDLHQINEILYIEGISNIYLTQELINKFPFYTNPFFLKTQIKYYKENATWLESEIEIWEYYTDFELEQYRFKQLKKGGVNIPQLKNHLKKVGLIQELQGLNQINDDDLYSILGENYAKFIDNPFIQKQSEFEKTHSFVHRQYQEYFAAKVLKELSFEKFKSIVLIENLNKIRPGLNNLTSLVLTLSSDDLFNSLSNFLIDSNIEIIIKTDSLRLPEDKRIEIFKNYFQKHCIEKTLWIGTHSPISDIDLAKFADSLESFNYLIHKILDKNLNYRTRVSAINLIEEFKNVDDQVLIDTITIILNGDDSKRFKSIIVRLINVLNPNKRGEEFRKIINRDPNDSNKEWNRSLLAVLSKLENIDDFFDYLKNEFLWSNKIVLRDDDDSVHRGNSWIVNDLVLKLKDESNFLELGVYYFDDFRLQLQDLFKNRLIDKCLEFENIFPGFISRLLSLIQESNRNRNYYNDDILIELIHKSNYQLEAFKTFYLDESKKNFQTSILAKITTKETIDFYISKLSAIDLPFVHLQGYRNQISNYRSRELAIYFEEQLNEKGIDLGQKLPTKEEVLEYHMKINKEIQDNFNLLFDTSLLINKIENINGIESETIINGEFLRSLESEIYKNNQDWFRGLGIEYEILFSAIHLFGSFSVSELKDKLIQNHWIQITTLKRRLESNKNSQYKIDLNQGQVDLIKRWIQETSKSFEFNELIQFDSSTGFSVDKLAEYRFLKIIYYFFELDQFSSSFDQNFLLESLLFYELEEFDPFSEKFEMLQNKIDDKSMMKDKVIEYIEMQPISSAMEKLVVSALTNNYTEVFSEIKDFLKYSRHSPGDKLFNLYAEKDSSEAFFLTQELANDTSIGKGWRALVQLTETGEKKDFCIDKALLYLESGQTEFKSNALGILFKLNHQKALFYFKNGIGLNPLYNIPNSYYSEYSVSLEFFLANFEELFVSIYKTVEDRDELDRDWEFSANNPFFSQLALNVLKNSENKVEAYGILINKLKEVRTESEDDRIIFFSNSIAELITNNYISLMSEPLSFNRALELTNSVMSL